MIAEGAAVGILGVYILVMIAIVVSRQAVSARAAAEVLTPRMVDP